MKRLDKVLGDVAKRIEENKRALAQGTPLTLYGASENALLEILSRPHPEEIGASIITRHIRDYMAHKFGEALLSEDPKTVAVVRELWSKLTGETL